MSGEKATKKCWQRMGGLNGTLLTLYITLVFSAYFFTATEKVTYWVRWTILVLFLSALGSPALLRWIRKRDALRVEVPPVQESDRVKNEGRWRAAFLLVPLTVFLVKYGIYYPGGFAFDTVVQVGQVLEGPYIDWHPVIQTLLSVWLPLTVTGGWFGSLALFQVLALALTIWYALCRVMAYRGKRYAVLSLLFIICNPVISNMAVITWKDTAFAVCALLVTTYAMNIRATGGAWLKRPWNAVFLVLAMALTSVIRHNGILFTLPLMAAVVLWVGFRRTILLCVGIVVLIAGIRGPLYTALDVRNPGFRKEEMLGMPMTVIGAVVKYAPENLDEETRKFVDQVAPQEAWQKYYEYGNFNYLKETSNFDPFVVEDGGFAVIGMALRCLVRSPREAIIGFLKLTEGVYSLCGDYAYYDFPRVQKNGYGIQMLGVPALRRANETLTEILYTVCPWLFMYPGAMHLVLLALILARFRLNRREDWKNILFVLPVFIYNFGTALLMTGANDCHRFFFYTFLIMPLLVAMIRGEVTRLEG